MVKSKRVDKRDMRDPEKLYDRIRQIQKNNPGMRFTAAADMADGMYRSQKNGQRTSV